MRRAVLGLLILAACSGGAGTVNLPEGYRDQIHAASGHDPNACTDLRGTEAAIAITDDGFSPVCAIVGASQDVKLTNAQAIDDTWIVADPPTELEIPRHTRLVFEIPAETTAVIEQIGEQVGTGVWVCYGRESSHDCTLIVLS